MGQTFPDPATAATDLVLGGHRGRALRVLLQHPTDSLHLRELARRIGAPPGTLRRDLARLAEAGVVARSRVGNLVLYRADPTCPIYDELRGIALKTAELARRLRGALAPLARDVSVAFLHGDPEAERPRDLVVVATIAPATVVSALAGCAGDGVAAAVRTRVYPPDALRKKARKKDPQLARLMKGPKVFLVGRDDDLRRLAGKRRTPAA